MHRFLLRAAFFMVVIAVVDAGSARAQKRRVDPALVGDGAADCSAAKRAAAGRPGRAPFSVASPNLDITYYHLDLALEMADDSLSGVVRVEGRVVGSTMSVLTLDLAPSMIVTSVESAGGTPLVFSHPGAALHITLPAPAGAGATVAVDVAYHGQPVSNGFGNFVFGTRNGARLAWSLSEPYGAREWWPCKDHPSDKADSVRVTVTVPSQYRVGSQGLLVGETPSGGNTTYDWVSHYPIANYLVSVAIGEYDRYQGTYDRPAGLAALYGPLSLPLDHLVYNDRPSLPGGWAAVTGALEVEEGWFGPYPFASEKYGHSEFTFNGGMEHQTMSSMGGSTLSVVTHELAHQWYGDSISPKTWPHLWLNEGFATYAELLYWEAYDSVYPGTYEAVLGSRYRFARNPTGTLVLGDTTSVNDMFDPSLVYAKGGIVLYMLRYVVNDDAVFRQIMQAYAADPALKYGNAVTADFQRVAENVSGLDLDAFFRQWVTDGTGYPTYASSSVWKPAGAGYRVWVTLVQTQTEPQSNTPVFDMPVEVVIHTASGDPRERVRNHQRSQVFQFDVASKPTSVSIDPDMRILRSDDVASTTRSLPPYPTIATLGPNPANGLLQVQYSLDRDDRVDINVYDVGGRRVLTQVIPSAQLGVQFAVIDTSPLASGVYFMRLSTRTGEAAQKFVVVR